MTPGRSRGPVQLLSSPGGRLGGLLEQARTRDALHRRVAPLLGTELAGLCRATGLEGGVLVLTTPSPAWATRLRYHSPEICRKLSEGGLPVMSVRITVQPPSVPTGTPGPVRPNPVLSGQSAQTLESAAAGISHAPLADALRRLARNSRSSGN
jgi:hypothetical protein